MIKKAALTLFLILGLLGVTQTSVAAWGACPVSIAGQCGTGVDSDYRCQEVRHEFGKCTISLFVNQNAAGECLEEPCDKRVSDVREGATQAGCDQLEADIRRNHPVMYKTFDHVQIQCDCRWVADASCSNPGGGDPGTNPGGNPGENPGPGSNPGGNPGGGSPGGSAPTPTPCAQLPFPHPPIISGVNTPDDPTSSLASISLTWESLQQPFLSRYYLEVYPSDSPAVDQTYVDYPDAKAVIASSRYEGTFHEALAFDIETFAYWHYGITRSDIVSKPTFWAGQLLGKAVVNSEWIGFDFGTEPTSVATVTIQQYPDRRAQVGSVILEATNNPDVAWDVIKQVSIKKDGTDVPSSFSTDLPETTKYRYWRVKAIDAPADDFPWAVSNIEFLGYDQVVPQVVDMAVNSNLVEYSINPPFADSYFVRVVGSRTKCREKWSDWSKPARFTVSPQGVVGTPDPVPSSQPSPVVGTPYASPLPTSQPSPVVGTPVIVPAQCVGITASQAIATAGESVQFTCEPVANANTYEFRYSWGSNKLATNLKYQTLEPVRPGQNVSVSLQMDRAGVYTVECRPCFGNNTCAPWQGSRMSPGSDIQIDDNRSPGRIDQMQKM